MKKIISLLLTIVLVLSLFAGCVNTDNLGVTNPSDSKPTESQPTEPKPTEPKPTEPQPTEPVDPWASYECITIAEALTKCEEFVATPSTERFYIRATIKSIDNDTYGQMTIEDATGSIMVYGTSNADGSVRYDKMESKPKAGDEVLIYGTLQNYKGNTKEVQNGWIIDFISKGGNDNKPTELPADGTELTIGQILELPVATGVTTTQHYIVKATVESIANAAYGQMWITDGTDRISVYGSYNEDGSIGYANMADKPYKGDLVTLKCTVQNFNGTMEIKQAYIIDFTHVQVEIDPNEYTSMTIAAARDAAKGTKVKVSGVVAQITYANGMKPSGVILVDGTSSIYVYDGDLAARCKIGNTVSIYASKTYWVLESEQNNANKFGYAGCNQLEGATVISIDESVTAFDKSWIQDSSVKEILDTPVSTDITSLIFKVTAQVKRVDGNGFINYYINDLDGLTGTYTYTQCSGSDFAWLDQFDGKICTVYLMALNAKSSAAGCAWRFLPVAVVDEGFDVSTVNGAEIAVKFYGATQFLSNYTGNPAMNLLTSIDSELCGIKGAALTYVSSDPSVISVDGNVMNCLSSGTATITVSSTYNGKTYSQDVTITVKITSSSETYPTVADAIGAQVGDKVIVKGIVGPSLVNQDGFYLIDETGIIAVLTDAETLASLEIGYEVILEGERYFKSKSGGNWGNTCINGAKVVINNYGSHEYSTASFDGVKTLAEFNALSTDVDFTTSVFTVTATVEVVETAYYTNIKLVDGSTSVNLYCSSAGQYSWLKQYNGQKITMELAPCNWSSKENYPGCVLAVIHADGSKTVNDLNFR